MIKEDFKLIVITPAKDTAGEHRFITELFDAGMQLLHLRKPVYTMEEMRKLLNAIPTSFHSKIVIHSHYGLLNEFNLKGAHLPEKIRKDGDTKNISKIVSTSFHNLDDIFSVQTKFEYAFFSPVFQSVSKQGYRSSWEPKIFIDFFAADTERILFPIIALSGITDNTILETKNMGFGGAACIGYIWENPNPVAQFRKILRVLD